MLCQFLLYRKVTQSHTQAKFPFFYYPPSWCIREDWREFPVLFRGTSLLIYSQCHRLDSLTPNL